MKSFWFGGASAVILAWGLAVVPANAQNTPAPARAGVLEEVVVTARRQEERLQEVPVAVTALSSAQLEARQITQVADLQSAVPTLQYGSGAAVNGRQGLSFALRGLRSAAVTVYSSEIVRNTQTVASFYDLGSVQVLKGPQGTLFGSNSTAGAIVFQPQRPKDHFEASVEARAGNYSLYGGTAILNVPLGDKAAVRVALDGEDRNGFVKRVNGGTALDADQHFNARVSLLVNPTDRLTNLTVAEGYTYTALAASYYPTEFRPCTAQFTQMACFYAPPFYFGPSLVAQYNAAHNAGPFRSTLTGDIPYYKQRSEAVSNITDFKAGELFGEFLGDVTFRSILGYTHNYVSTQNDHDGLPVRAILAFATSKNITRSFEGQMLGGNKDKGWTWILGVYASDSETRSRGRTPLFLDIGPPFLTDYTQNAPSRNSVTQKAVYAQTSLEVVKNVRLTAGYRATKTESEANTNQFLNGRCNLPALAPGVNVAACTQDLQATFKEPSWTFGADWQIDPNTLLYIVTRRGFNAGGFNTAAQVVSRTFYKPERLTDIEIGFKRDWDLGWSQLRTNAAIFRNKYSNIQRTQVVFENGQFQQITVNAAKATLKGFEVETSLELPSGFTLRANGSGLDAKYGSFPFQIVDPVTRVLTTVDLSKNDLAQAPKWTGTAGVDYRHDIADVGKFSATLDYAYQSSVNFSDFNQTNPSLSSKLNYTSIQKGYGLVNARIGLADLMGADLSVDLWVRNLANKLYYIEMSNQGPFGISLAVPGAPRTFGVTVRKRF